MASIKDTAKEYEPEKVKTIADLDTVSVDLDIQEENKVEFPYKFILVDDERYRVPNSVLNDLKTILEEKPELKNFKVKKTGEGLKTEYTVISLD